MKNILRISDLPQELFDKVKVVSPSSLWRNKNLYTLLGSIESEVIRCKRINDDFWRTCEGLGNAIHKWILSDKDRIETFNKMCDYFDKTDFTNPDRFFNA